MPDALFFLIIIKGARYVKLSAMVRCFLEVQLIIFIISHFQPVRLAVSYRYWFVYVREKYCWLIRVNSVYVRGLASQPSQPLPADQAAPLWKE